MTKFVSLCAVALIVLFGQAAQAREAEVRSFAPTAGTFQLIEPGFERPPPPADTLIETPPSSVQLAEEFASMAAQPPDPIPVSGVDALHVPLWMRGEAGPAGFASPPGAASSTSCGPVRYAPHPRLTRIQELRRQRHFGRMAAAACEAGVPVHLFDALIIQESGYNPRALSSKGASGMTQLMPATARRLGVFDRWDVEQNLKGGARYLRAQLDQFGNWALALGAYNAGPGNVLKYGGLPPFRETRDYVRSILTTLDAYQANRMPLDLHRPAHGRSVTLSKFRR